MNKQNLFIASFGLIISLPAWVWLFWYDWKIALAVFFIVWGNNLIDKANRD